MTSSVYLCNSLVELEAIANEIVDKYNKQNVFLFSGKMGVGKTTLIKEICRALNVEDVVNSPTFSIVNEYKTSEGESVFHFDLYRIKSSEELLDIGYEEYLFGGSKCLIEWPELALGLMPSGFVLVKMEVLGNNESRRIEVTMMES